MNLRGGKKRVRGMFMNQLSALKQDKSQRLVIGYAAGRRVSKKLAYQLHRQERARSAHTVSSQYLQMSSERPTCTRGWGIRFWRSRWKSASGALSIYKSTET